jgi:prepilin-type N-terminal cleavage/methylation domain-containing protein
MTTTEAALAPARGGRAGFTLVEVLIAMVVLAVGLLALESMAIGASRKIATANRMTEYTLIASQQLETTQARVRQNLNPQSGDQVLANGTLVATTVVQNVQGTNRLWTITVTVTPPSGSRVGISALTPTTVTGIVSQ